MCLGFGTKIILNYLDNWVIRLINRYEVNRILEYEINTVLETGAQEPSKSIY